MAKVTLIGTRLATVDQEFVYNGESAACEGCPYRQQCLNLTEGRRYRVVEKRDGASTLDCAVHDSGVTAVEVEPVSVQANVADSNAYIGSKASLEGPCPHTDCPSHQYCEPAGLNQTESYRIAEVIGEPPHDFCMLDRELTLVEFEPPEDA